MVDGLQAAERQRLRVFAEFYRIEAAGNCSFTAKQRAALFFTRYLVRAGRLDDFHANYGKRWGRRPVSLGSEWGSPFF